MKPRQSERSGPTPVKGSKLLRSGEQTELQIQSARIDTSAGGFKSRSYSGITPSLYLGNWRSIRHRDSSGYGLPR